MKFYNIYFKRFLTFLILTASAFNISFGQADTGYTPATLGNHKFIQNSKLGTPFTNTFYKTLLGVGQTVSLQIPPIIFNGEPVFELQGDLVFTTLDIEYQQQIRDWMAFYGEIELIGNTGTKTGALVSQGLNLLTGYRIGWKFELYNKNKLALSTNLNLSNSSYTTFDFSKFIQNILDSGKLTKDNKLVQNVPLVRGGIGINCVYALNKTFGLQGQFYGDYGESAVRGEGDIFNYSYALGMDIDLNPKYNVPLGFFGGFYHTSVPQNRENPNKDPNLFILQINYTGKKLLNVGAELGYQWYEPEGFDNTIQFMMLNLNTTIYF